MKLLKELLSLTGISYIKSKSKWHILEVSGTICIASNNYCQVLINFLNQNLGKSSILVTCQEDVGNIVVHQNVGVHGIISL